MSGKSARKLRKKAFGGADTRDERKNRRHTRRFTVQTGGKDKEPTGALIAIGKAGFYKQLKKLKRTLYRNQRIVV